MHTSVTTLPATCSNPSTICQQKYGLPTASEDRNEYLCFITPIALKAGRQASTAAHLATWFPIYPASEHKYQLTASNLTERSVRRPPLLWLPSVIQMPVCQWHLRHTNMKQGEVEREIEWWRHCNRDEMHPFSVLLLLHSAIHTDLAFGPQ